MKFAYNLFQRTFKTFKITTIKPMKVYYTRGSFMTIYDKNESYIVKIIDLEYKGNSEYELTVHKHKD